MSPRPVATLLALIALLLAGACLAPPPDERARDDEPRTRHAPDDESGDGDDGAAEGEGDPPGEGEGDVDGGEGEGGEGEGEPPAPCAPGFVEDGAACRALGLTPLVTRTREEVCARFNAEYQWVSNEWDPSPGVSDTCDTGTVPQEALDNGLLRTNLYRWLAGVAPASLDAGLFEQQQHCATLMHAIGFLTHGPDDSMPCYTSQAHAGASSSNIAGGGGIAGSVDMYVDDWGNESTYGHRRWVIGPYMSVTQFGVRGGYSCMYTFGLGGPGADPGYVTWPPAGFAPVDGAHGGWTYESNTRAPTLATHVFVAEDRDGVVGDEVEVPNTILLGGYGHYGTAITFTPPSGGWSAGTTVRVRITDTRTPTGGVDGEVRYTVQLVDCAP